MLVVHALKSFARMTDGKLGNMLSYA